MLDRLKFAGHWTERASSLTRRALIQACRVFSLTRIVSILERRALIQARKVSILERRALVGFVLLVAVLTPSVFSPSVLAQGPAGRSCNTIDPPVSHWSAEVKIGPSYTSTGGVDVNVGGSVEYSVNPFAGFGFQTLFGIRQNTLDLLGFGSLNLSNLTAPFRTDFWKRTNVFGIAGGGLRQDGIDFRMTSMLLLTGLDGEYNLNDALAFEVGGDLLYGLEKNIHVNVGLRYKFGVSSMKHAHNISMNEYRPQPSPIIIRQIVWADYNAASLKRLEVLEASNAELKLSLQNTESKINSYMELLAIQKASKDATKAVTKSNSKPAFTVVLPPLPFLVPVVSKATEP